MQSPLKRKPPVSPQETRGAAHYPIRYQIRAIRTHFLPHFADLLEELPWKTASDAYQAVAKWANGDGNVPEILKSPEFPAAAG